MKPGSVEPQPARDCFATLAMTTLDIPGRRRPRARMTRCHVWTAAFGQGEFGGVGRWSGAVMYPACWRGRLSAGPDGLRGSGSEHGGALLRRDDEAECRDPGPDHFAVAAWCSLRVSGRMARRGEGGGSGAEAGSFLCWTGGTILCWTGGTIPSSRPELCRAARASAVKPSPSETARSGLDGPSGLDGASPALDWLGLGGGRRLPVSRAGGEHRPGNAGGLGGLCQRVRVDACLWLLGP